MRKPIKRLTTCFIGCTILLNLYIFSQLYTFQPSDQLLASDYNEPDQLIHNAKTRDEFLVLDWTSTNHIFQEQDPIRCDFSHITLEYCLSKFDTIINETLRLHLVERCFHLSKLTVRWTPYRSRLQEADVVAYHSIYLPLVGLPELIRNDHQQQFSLVYILESEVNSVFGDRWHQIDFSMWYNLERSYPEPTTYFDLKTYLNQLFAPVQVSFFQKTTTASIVWVISNCLADNARQSLIQQLMTYIHVDSYGGCLNNIQSQDMEVWQQSNTRLYSTYKFVIAIENSNCEDYVTEKLIHAFGSTSIPIIASRQGKPDYTRFAPKYSYINVYDYKSVKDLADYLSYLSKNETAYNEYLWYRRLPANKYASSDFVERSLSENLQLADEILGENATMRQWLLTRETSINKYCKLTQFIRTNYWQDIYNRKKLDRPTADEVCLPEDDLLTHFSK